MSSFNDYLLEELKDPEFAILFIIEAYEVGDKEYFEKVIKQVIEARK